jgi:hypothetical protein
MVAYEKLPLGTGATFVPDQSAKGRLVPDLKYPDRFIYKDKCSGLILPFYCCFKTIWAILGDSMGMSLMYSEQIQDPRERAVIILPNAYNLQTCFYTSILSFESRERAIQNYSEV